MLTVCSLLVWIFYKRADYLTFEPVKSNSALSILRYPPSKTGCHARRCARHLRIKRACVADAKTEDQSTERTVGARAWLLYQMIVTIEMFRKLLIISQFIC